MQRKDDRKPHMSAARCDRALKYINAARIANCSSALFGDPKLEIEQQKKCKDATLKMAAVADICEKKFG